MEDLTIQVTKEIESPDVKVVGDRKYKRIVKKDGSQMWMPEGKKVTNRRLLHLSPQEQSAILEAAKSYGGELGIKYHALIVALMLCGLRRENAIHLKWKYLNYQLKLIIIPYDKHKTGKRTQQDINCPLMPEFVSDIQYLRKGKENPEGYVFTHRKRGGKHDVLYDEASVNDIVSKIGKKAGIKPKDGFVHVNPHLLRHTFCWNCKRNRIRKEVTIMWMGHMDSELVDEVYGLPDEYDSQEEMKNIVEKRRYDEYNTRETAKNEK